MTSFEQAFADTERAADGVVSASSALLKTAKDLVKAARDGDIPKIRRTTERLGVAVQAVRQEVGNAQSAWPITPDEEEKALSESFSDELIEAANRQGLRVRRQDDRLVAYPSLLRVLPGRRAVEIDKKAVTAIRPSRLVAQLKANAEKKPSSVPERFIEVLYNAYRYVVGANHSAGVPLHEVYNVLTLMPDVKRDYTAADFGRDLFFLDRSGKTQTKAGIRLSFPTATGTKGGTKVFSFVAPDGEVVTYYGIRFQQ
jgi:hypothetical protein